MTSYESRLYAALALEPIHVGTGGIGLGRVDLEVVRDPVTRLPKIPGSSLAGVYRAYVAMHEEDHGTKPSGRTDIYYPKCAGKDDHCGRRDCPVCTVFGFANDRDRGGFAGLASFMDGQILLFPVATMHGPKWVTTESILRDAGVNIKRSSDSSKETIKAYRACIDAGKCGEKPTRINFGWMYLEVADDQIEMEKTGLIKDITEKVSLIKDSIYIVPEDIFSHIVNSNLEVRTSVSIEPSTGAAQDKALFSYEAIPRFTVLTWRVIARAPKHFKVKGEDIKAEVLPGKPIDDPADVIEEVKKAHDYMEYLGIGGMGTRGMGRVRILND